MLIILRRDFLSGQHVVEYRTRVKIALVNAFGNKCQICNVAYDRWVYDFHHVNPDEKLFNISGSGITRSKEKCCNEAKKCVMLCSNCHRILEHGGIEFNAVMDFDEEKFYKEFNKLTETAATIRGKKRDAKKAKIKCKACKSDFIPKTKRIIYCSSSCSEAYVRHRVVKPTKENLYAMLLDKKNFTVVGKEFGITDNAVRKWCRAYGIPSKTSDYKAISNKNT